LRRSALAEIEIRAGAVLLGSRGAEHQAFGSLPEAGIGIDPARNHVAILAQQTTPPSVILRNEK
jgi:hypothetical protein